MDDRSIIQLSTPRVTSALHVIRMSGESCLPFLKRHTGLFQVDPRRVYHKYFYHTQRAEVIDSIICFFLKAPKSYTGEDMAEIHTHGSLLIVDEILKLAQSEGFRLAEPGEFTYRAFLNGKVGLEQAEAIDGLIHSQSEFQKQNALQVLEKKISFRFVDLKNSLIGIQAELESVIEFPEEDIPEITEDKKSRYLKYRSRIDDIVTYFQEIHRNYRIGRKLAKGFQFVIVGSPNSGKSTLFNTLLREDRTLVSDQKGTTRDYICEHYSISDQKNNYEVMLYDTAGVHENPELIEAMGIEKLPEIASGADLVIWLITNWDCYQEFVQSDAGKKILNSIRKQYSHNLHNYLWIFLNKLDVIPEGDVDKIKRSLTDDFPELNPPIQAQLSLLKDYYSSRKQIEDLFLKWITQNYRVDYESPALLNQRQGDLVERILTKLLNIRDKINTMEDEEIVVEDFRYLNHDLKELSLESGPEEIYDLLFSRFCIGK